MSVEASIPSASLDDVVRLLSEQNELLKKIAANANPPVKASRFSDADWTKARAIATSVALTEEAQFVAVDAATGEHATGRTIFAAADALGAPPERTLAVRAGGGFVRLGSPRRIG